MLEFDVTIARELNLDLILYGLAALTPGPEIPRPIGLNSQLIRSWEKILRLSQRLRWGTGQRDSKLRQRRSACLASASTSRQMSFESGPGMPAGEDLR